MSIFAGLKAVFLQVTLFAIQQPDGFSALKPGDQPERFPAGTLVLAAYAAVWIVLIAYLFLLWNRAGRLEKQMAALNARLRRNHEISM